MSVAAEKLLARKFAFSSSVEADVWHSEKPAGAYEWWYFDALADGGKEAIVITFLDNYVFSPRYNSVKSGSEGRERYPAVSFVYYEGGRPVYRCVNEFSAQSFSASEDAPACNIGESSFRFDTASYGSGYLITINATISNGRRIEATFEWLSIEADLAPGSFCHETSAHCWNMVAPRSDVSGRINIYDRKGASIDVRHFRGTGYHDHSLDNRWLPRTVRDWQWGRCHFGDSTAVFYRYCEIGDDTPTTKLYVIRDGEMRERDAGYTEQNYARDKYGIRYPTRLRLISDDNLRLRVKPVKVIDSSFHYLRFLSEMTLTLRDGKPRKTIGISEFLSPKTLKYRWLNWWTDLRIGRDGKGSRF
jgi:carotenoid 1,2-hydratase